MKTKLKIAGVLTSAIAIAGCSSSTKPSVTIGPAEEAQRIFSQDTGDAGDAIQNGETLTARKVASGSVDLDYSADTTVLRKAGQTDFKVSRNDNGELTMSVDGVEHVFTAADREVEDDGMVYGYSFADDDADRYYNMFNYTGEIDDIKTNGQGYAEVFGYQTNQIEGGARNVAGFAVVGTETRDEDLAALPTATYEGRGRLNIRPQTGFEDNGQSRDRLRGDLSMNANFADGTISGKLDDLTYQAAQSDIREGQAGAILLNESRFDINGFAGSVSADATLAADGVQVENGAYSGAFYGGEAQEVGGVISGSYVGDDGAARNADGFFIGYKQNPVE